MEQELEFEIQWSDFNDFKGGGENKIKRNLEIHKLGSCVCSMGETVATRTEEIKTAKSLNTHATGVTDGENVEKLVRLFSISTLFIII